MKNLTISWAEFFSKRAANKLETILQIQTLANLKNKLHLMVKASAPIFGAILFNLVIYEAAHAQGGGPIFSGSSNNLANIIREGLKLMAIVLFCLGAVGIAWAIFNKMTGKEWGSQAFGAILSFAFGTIVAVFWQIAQGRAVSVDTNF